MPLTLAIETSNPNAPGGGMVALGMVEIGAPGSVRMIRRETLRPVGRDEDDLQAAIDRLVRGAAKSSSEIGLVAVSAGPGGFTSLRMACAAAKMTALAVGARCVAVPSALSAALSAPAAVRAGPFAVALAVKHETVHLTVFAPGFERSGTPPTGHVVTADALAQTPALETLVANRHLPQSFRAAAAARGIAIIEPVWDAGAVLAAAANLPAIAPAMLNPDYAREPEAVTLWRKHRAKSGEANEGA